MRDCGAVTFSQRFARSFGHARIDTWRRLSAAARRVVSRSPATSIYLFVVTVTTLMLQSVDSQFADQLLRQQSTNLVQMSRDAPRVLVLSAFFLASRTFTVELLIAVVVLAVAERMLGTARWFVVAVAGHVGASVVTTIAIWLQVRWGYSDASVVYPVDVGVSYVVAAEAAALLVRCNRRGRVAAGAVTLLWFGLPVLTNRTFTDAGHLVAFAIGLGVARAFRSTSSPSAHRTVVGRWIGRSSNGLLVAAIACGLASGGLAAMLINPPSTADTEHATALARATIVTVDANGDAKISFAVSGRAIEATLRGATGPSGRPLRANTRRTVSYEQHDPQNVTLGRTRLPRVNADSFFILATSVSGLATVALLLSWLARNRPRTPQRPPA